MTDYILCISVRLLGFFFRKFPLRFSLFIGACVGGAGYYFRRKRRQIAYANLKAAFCSQKTPRELITINKKTFRNLGRNLIEVFLFPKVDKRYVAKYIRIEGIEEIDKAKRAGKGVIFLTAHLGNWELASLVSAIEGYPLKVLARQQKFPRLNRLLISYRETKGCRVIPKGMATREIFRSLKNNEIVGILADQDAGARGVFINFFGRDASTAPGAIKFAWREKSKILPAFIIRESGPYQRIVIKPPLELERGDNLESNLRIALKQFTSYLEDFISNYPEQWLWQHKRWKSTPSRSIVILSDGKAGHLNQSKAVAKAIKNVCPPRLVASYKIIDVKFKNRFTRNLLAGCGLFASADCQGCMRCLRCTLRRESYQKLITEYADIIISAGRSLCGVNLILSKENCAKSIVLMKPPSFLANRFNLIFVPKHDNFKRRPNVVETLAAPSLIDSEYLSEQAEKLKIRLKESNSNLDLRLRGISKPGVSNQGTENRLRLGVLIGGDSLHFKLSEELMVRVIDAILEISSQLNAELLLSTSRRTSSEIDNLVKERLAHFKLCKLLIIANENNIEGAVGGILGLSQVVIVSGESISMVSEATSSGKYVVVFKPESKSRLCLQWRGKISESSNKLRKRSGLSGNRVYPEISGERSKHEKFLDYLAQKGFITLVRPEDLVETVKRIWIEKPPPKLLDDNRIICEAVKGLL